MVNIFIANLDWSITSEDLKTTFATFGEVHYAHVVFEKDTKRSRGYGYVEMESAESAIAAIEALNGMEINGRAIDVKIASPKSNRPKKEEKPQEHFVPKKKPFNKPGGFNNNRGGGSGYQRREGGAPNREGGYRNNNGYNSGNREGGYNRDRSEGGFNRERSSEGGYNRDYNRPRPEGNQERVMRPRRSSTDSSSERRYEKVERAPRKSEDNE